MPKFAVTVNDNGVRKRVVLESATEPTEAEVLSALRVQKSLSEQDRLRLDGIVSKMESNGERPEDIQFVVNDFKAKYERSAAPTNPVKKAESNPLTQSDIDQLSRLKTESVGIIENPPEVSTLLNRTSTGLFLTGWVVSLLATFAVSWILARRRYNRQPGGIRTTIQETESNPASFRRASLGVRRLASALFWLFTIGCSSIAVMAADYDLRAAFVGPFVGMTFWGLIRGIDWIVRGFKFGGYDIDGKR